MIRRLLLIGIVGLGGILLFISGADAASLYSTPSSGVYNVQEEFDVTLRVNTEGTAINAAESTLTFPTALLEVTNVSQSGIFSFWPVLPVYSNANGTVVFSGGLPTPGYNGTEGSIITITFRAIGSGNATLATSGSRVLANDGQGTNVLGQESTLGTFFITEQTLFVPVAPEVSSPSHPDFNAWYSDPNPIFEWASVAGVTGHSFVYNDVDIETPDEVVDTTNLLQAFTNIGDGVWYFHIRSRNDAGWGASAHFRTQIDTTSPESFIIELLDGTEVTSGNVRVRFESNDALSGVEYYDLIIDGDTPVRVPVGENDPYTMTNVSSGTHQLQVVAYDRAGNSSQALALFTVNRSNPPVLVIDETDQPDAIILETIEEILPEPILDITRGVSRVVEALKQNEGVIRVIEDVITPVVSTAAIVSATGVATTLTALQLSNLAYLFLRLGYLWFIPVAVGKRRKPWGLIFDSTTNQPVRRAVVRIFSKEFNKLKESQITDNEGRFGFLVDMGKYYVTVSRFGYQFPSKLLRSASATPYENIYLGETLEVKQKIQQALSINVPIDPDNREMQRGRIVWLRFLNTVGHILERLSLPLLLVGTLSSWATLIIQPSTNNYLFLMVYGLLIILKYMVSHHYEKSWGSVTDSVSNKPIELGVVRIYDIHTSTVVGTRVTNNAGQFQALVAPGKYYIVVVKSGYETFQSKPIVVTRDRGIIRLNIKLRPKVSGEATTGQGAAIDLEPINANKAAFAPPEQHEIGEVTEEDRSTPAATDASPFAPPEQHEVEKRADSLPPKKPKNKK